MNPTLDITERTRLRRMRERGHFDRQTIYSILDAMPLCHLGYVQNGTPVVMPTIQWREGDHVYWHASNGGRGAKAWQAGEVCLTVSMLDGLVLARSGLHHSANYRAVMVFGRPNLITDDAEKNQKLNNLIDALYPGRSQQLRPNSPSDLKQTAVFSLPLEEASAKIRAKGPVDDEADYAVPVWSGTLPVSMAVGQPEADPRNLADVPLPDHAKNFSLG